MTSVARRILPFLGYSRTRPAPRGMLPAALAMILLAWIMATPRNGGPDEPSHSVASAALLRGDRSGELVDLGFPAEMFRVPAMVGEPNPACFAFAPDQPADCAGHPDGSTALAARESTSAGYPVWGHLLPGLASLVPSPQAYSYLARAANALVAVALLVLSMRRLAGRNSWMAIGLLAGLTPIAWFSMAIVNPSALAIAGGAALWTGLLILPTTTRSIQSDRLLVAGWLAVLLARRDGPLLATLVVLTACVATSTLPSDRWRRLTPVQRWTVAAALPLPLLPLLDGPRGVFDLALALSPVGLLVAEVAARTIGRISRRITTLWWCVAWGVGAAMIVAFASVFRSAGSDINLLTRIVGATGEHLRQLVGLLGWLDTPVPGVAVVTWWAVVGMLAAVAILAGGRSAPVALMAIASIVVIAWALELGTGDTSGTYWQGRYSMPFVVGLPLLLAHGAHRRQEFTVRLEPVVAGALWVVWNLAFAQSLRRWGVGVDGTMYPWRWDAATTPGPPLLWLIVHAAATAALVASVLSGIQGRRATAVAARQ